MSTFLAVMADDDGPLDYPVCPNDRQPIFIHVNWSTRAVTWACTSLECSNAHGSRLV
jgi:hypothetical protein